jgi:hypothetical protein
MTTAEEPCDEAELLRVLRAYHDAMVEANTGDLDKMLDEAYALVHITGYVQPKGEWLGVIRSGQFAYHTIDVDEDALSVNLNGSTAVASGRGIFDATINGTRNPWRLRFTMQFAKRNGRWAIGHARYTTF